QYDFDINQSSIQPTFSRPEYSKLARSVIRAVDQTLPPNPKEAERHLDTPVARNMFSAKEYDSLQADIASAYYYKDNIEKAYVLSSASARRSKGDVPQGSWIAGLS